MARTRSGADLINDAYRRADCEALTDRHPRSDVLRYVNQGAAEVYDMLVEARGRAYYRAPPHVITTASGTSRYALDPSFYRLISVRMGGPTGYSLIPYTSMEEPWLRSVASGGGTPTHYELQPGYIEILPMHSAGQTLVVDYIPIMTDLTDSPDSGFDGINGWEEYVVDFAACCMLTKDDELQVVNTIRQDMGRLKARIDKLARGRDAFRAERVKDVRRGGFGGWR
jgi:hypothetical protein